jgi:predicted Zn-dependent protease with MMP-like domain
MSDKDFNDLITRAMDELPQKYIKGLNNVAIVQADDPSEPQNSKAGVRQGGLLLGLYEGVPLINRGAGYTFVLPDKITIFKNSILKISGGDPERLFEQVKRTLWHEIAHYYGLDHKDIHRLENQSN